MLAEIGNDTLNIYEIELFDWYIKETEAILSQMLSSERVYIQDQIASGISDVKDSGMIAVEYYTKRIRYSHIIYLTSLLETCLERACSRLTIAVGKESMPFALADLSGNQWSKKCKFLERYGHFDLPNDIWLQLEDLILVRNYLVHENGNTINLPGKKRDALKKWPGLDIDGYEFKIEEEFVRYAYNAVKLFVQAIEERIGTVIRRAQHPQGVS